MGAGGDLRIDRCLIYFRDHFGRPPTTGSGRRVFRDGEELERRIGRRFPAFRPFLLVMAIVVIGVAGCSRVGPTGTTVTETIELSYFDAVSIVGRWDVQLEFGEAIAVEVEGDSGILAGLSAQVKDQTLRPVLTGVPADNTPRARIILTAATGLSFDGPIEAVFSGTLRTEDVEIVLLGSANFRIDELDAGRVALHVAESSSLAAKGRAESVNVVADRKSVIFLDELDVGAMSVELRDESVLLARVSQSLDGTASGESVVYATGEIASVNISRTGGACFFEVDEIGPEMRAAVDTRPSC